jgi:hypothetical protein
MGNRFFVALPRLFGYVPRMSAAPSFREMNLRIFRGESVPHPLFQPRAEPWYHWHTIFGKLPRALAERGLQGFYDDLHLSMRYMQYYTGLEGPVVELRTDRVQVEERESGRRKARVYRTPAGDLLEEWELTVDQTWRKVVFPVRDLEDLKKLRRLFGETSYGFSVENFDRGDRFVAHRGVPQFWVPKSPYQALAQQWMKLPDLIYALADYPAEVEATMAAIDASYDRLYEEIIRSGRTQIVNFGENVHEQLLSPTYFERYLVPFYEKRSGQLRSAGIHTHVHIDGYFHALLPYLRTLPFDGYEALTPRPQGDLELEEIAEHISGRVLLDGIPAVMFLPSFPREQLMATVERIVELFHPRLILGVSDEVPEGTDMEAIERVRLISDWCRSRGSGRQ